MPELTREAAEAVSFLPIQGEGTLARLCRLKRGGRFGSILILVNPGDRPVAFQLPEGLWTVLCDGERSDLWKDASVQAPALLAVPAVSLLILGK